MPDLWFSAWRQLMLGVVCALSAATAGATGNHGFDCQSSRYCGLPGDGPYPHLVLGTVTAVADRADLHKVFQQVKRASYWQALPKPEAGFLDAVRLVEVRIPAGLSRGPVTVMLSREEFDTVEFHPGDLVRYSPHDEAHENRQFTNPADAAYWHLVGCVAVLCRAGDTACMQRYRGGVFRRSDGVAVDLKSGSPIAGGAPIDPVTLLPR